MQPFSSSHCSIASKKARSRSPRSPGRPCQDGAMFPALRPSPSGKIVMAAGHARPIGARACMYCTFIPKGCNANTTGAAVLETPSAAALTTNVRRAPATSSVCRPGGNALPSHAADATRACVRRITASTPGSHGVRWRSRWRTPSGFRFGFPQRRIALQQLFPALDVFVGLDALVLADALARHQPQDRLLLPRLGEDFGILHRHVVDDGVEGVAAVAFGDAQLLAVNRADTSQPGVGVRS